MRAQIAAGLNHPHNVEPYIEPYWPPWQPRVPEGGLAYSEWGARAAGWPFLCLSSRSATVSGGARQTRWLLRMRPCPPMSFSSAGRDPDRGTIPLRPLLPGLGGNALVLGAPVFVLLLAVGPARAAVRQRRGRCISCGYDRRGLSADAACPECGKLAREGN